MKSGFFHSLHTIRTWFDPSVIGSFMLTLLLFLMIPLTSLLQNIPDPSLMMRNIVAIPLPVVQPKPPEVLRKPPSIKASRPYLNTPLANIPFNPLNVPLLPGIEDVLSMEVPAISLSLENDMISDMEQVFSLESLSSPPSVLTTPHITFPNELRRRGVKQGEVCLNIFIDEKGKCRVESVNSFTHAELVPVAKKVANETRFSITRIDGLSVKVRGKWPLVIKAPDAQN